MGFYVNDDYWHAIESYSNNVQNEIVGSLVRLYFKGEDQLDSIKYKDSKPVYLAVRERVSQARKKATRRGSGNGVDASNSASESADKSEPGVPDQNDDFAKKRERERENISTCTSTLIDTQPNQEDAPWLAFAKEAIAKYTEVTGRPCMMPSPQDMLNLHRIFDAGYSIDDVELVLRDKQRKWASSKKMSPYLRPKTLFGEQFEAYLAEAKCGTGAKIDAAAREFDGRI